MSEAVLEKEDAVSKVAEGKFMTFVLGNEEYGIEINKVREIIGMMEITAMPDMPEYVKGVINLRDKVIPVIDLRLKFHMAPKEYDERTAIIVVEISRGKSKTHTGIVVDTVCEVQSVTNEQIEAPPSFGAQKAQKNILGVAKINKKVKILLDINELLTTDELKNLTTKKK